MSNKSFFKLLLFSLLLCACGEQPQSRIKASTTEGTSVVFTASEPSFNELKIALKPNSDLTYAQTKSKINARRLELRRQNLRQDSLFSVFTEMLLNEIIPFWYGTDWSFEGHTKTPGEGEIACGYFVSTTLKHMGFSLNRYKLAQQSPINEAKSLASGLELLELNNSAPQENIEELQRVLKEGIYFIGFDGSHVGFLLKRESELFLIHSNYMSPRGVLIERIEDSEVFSFFTKLYIVDISTNQFLMENWLKGKEINIFFD